MTDLRDLSALALRESFMPDMQGEVGAGWYRHADTVLAVLADLPDDVIEKAAIELFRQSWNDRPSIALAVKWWGYQGDVDKSYWTSKARAAFAAVFGGEQGE